MANDQLTVPADPGPFRFRPPHTALLVIDMVCLAFSFGSTPAPADLPADEHAAARPTVPQTAPAEVAAEPAH